MNLFDENLQALINRFKENVAALTLNKENLEPIEKVLSELELNNISTINFLSTHSVDNSISMFVQIQNADESEIQISLEIACRLLGVDIENVTTVFNVEHPTYGYLINFKDKCEFYISLSDVKTHYCPEAIVGMLEEFKSKKPKQTYLGFDLADPNGDRTEVAA